MWMLRYRGAVASSQSTREIVTTTAAEKTVRVRVSSRVRGQLVVSKLI